MVTRNIYSQPDTDFVSYDAMAVPMSRVLTESITHGDDVYLPGQLDPTYEYEPDAIWLYTLDGRRYDSVRSDYPQSALTHAMPETELDGHFTHTVLLYNNQIKFVTDQDQSYLAYLGLPEWDPQIHTTDLNVIPAHAEAESLAYLADTEEWKAQQEAQWLATDPDYAARKAAGEITQGN